MATSDRSYHLRELEIAVEAGNPNRILPPKIPKECRVLDVGCGAGQTLIAAYPDRRSVGMDIDLDALRLGKTLTDQVDFVCGQAERLPYASATFDLVVARVSLPYTWLDQSLGEIRRVLRPGGRFWTTLHPFSVSWSQARVSRPKSVVFLAYVTLNSLLYHFAGRQFALRRRCESFQTRRGIERTLTRLGFEGIEVSLGRYFLVTARVPDETHR